MLLYKKVIKKIKLTKKKATDSWQKSNFTIHTLTTGLYPLLKLDFFLHLVIAKSFENDPSFDYHSFAALVFVMPICVNSRISRRNKQTKTIYTAVQHCNMSTC